MNFLLSFLFFSGNVFANECWPFQLKISGAIKTFNKTNCVGVGAQGSVFNYPGKLDKVIKIFHGNSPGDKPSNAECEQEFQGISLLKTNGVPVVAATKHTSEDGYCYLVKDKLNITLSNECARIAKKGGKVDLIGWESFKKLILDINKFHKHQASIQSKIRLRDWNPKNIMKNSSNQWVLIDFMLMEGYESVPTRAVYSMYFEGECFKSSPKFGTLMVEIQ